MAFEGWAYYRTVQFILTVSFTGSQRVPGTLSIRPLPSSTVRRQLDEHCKTRDLAAEIAIRNFALGAKSVSVTAVFPFCNCRQRIPLRLL